MQYTDISFRPLRAADFPMLRDWLSRKPGFSTTEK